MITDIWFRTSKSLKEVTECLGLLDVSFDAENYWEWAIGELHGAKLDVTRTHTRPPESTETRIFMLDNSAFPDELKNAIVQSLRPIVSGSIYCGQWIYVSGNDFALRTLEEFNGL